MFKLNKSLDKFRYPWYNHELPEIDSIVIGRVKSITDMGLFFELLDYKFKEAFMPLNQVSKKKFKSVRSIFKIGDIKPVLVLRIDEAKGYIDLSNKYIEMAAEDISRIERYANIIGVMMDWLKYIINKDKKADEAFNLHIDIDLWTRTMESTVWMYPKSEIHQVFKELSTGEATIEKAFPEFYEQIIKKENSLIDPIDLSILDQYIKNAFKFHVSLSIKMKLIVLSIDAISKIALICNAIKKRLQSDGYLVFLDITSPIYEFIIKDSNHDRIESYNETLENKLPLILDNFDDIEYSIERNLIV